MIFNQPRKWKWLLDILLIKNIVFSVHYKANQVMYFMWLLLQSMLIELLTFLNIQWNKTLLHSNKHLMVLVVQCYLDT